MRFLIFLQKTSFLLLTIEKTIAIISCCLNRHAAQSTTVFCVPLVLCLQDP